MGATDLAETFLAHKVKLESHHGFKMVRSGTVELHLARWWTYESGVPGDEALLQELMAKVGEILDYKIDPLVMAERLAEMPRGQHEPL